MSKRLNVGLFVSNLINDFDSSVYRGAERGAIETDTNLIVFPGRYLKPQYNDKERTKTDYQYSTIFSYASRENIDVLLILMGTIGTVLSEKEKQIFLDMYHDIPVIILADEIEGHKCLNFDNRSGLKAGIVDLIVNKNRKKIGMVSGPVTSEDAIERLNVYKETLQEYGLPVSEDAIVYGNFSEYSESVVEKLITTNPDLDAIVFANDQMAIGGYKVLKKYGYIIGEDIAVMGFDDSPMASILVPNLTTVRADAMDLGYHSVLEAVEYVKNGDCTCSPIETNLILRESSGGAKNRQKGSERDEIGAYRKVILEDKQRAAEKMLDGVYGTQMQEEGQRAFTEGMSTFLTEHFNLILGEPCCSPEQAGVLLDEALTAVNGSHAEVQAVIQLLDFFVEMVRSDFPEKEKLVADLFYHYMMRVAMKVASLRRKYEDELDELLWMSNSIARDMMGFGENTDMGFATVLDKLSRLGFQNAYLYSFDIPFLNTAADVWHDWQVPPELLLKSYFWSDGETKTLSGNAQKLSPMQLFNNEYIESDRRHTLLINLIFINEEQLGILLCELEYRKLSYLNSINAQLGSALKIIFMLRMQMGIQKQLEISLEKIKESNQILETISKVDELTGVYNRRGFFEAASKMMHNKKYREKKAILIFADLDNLKLINDMIGHDEGDFAIKSAAGILTDSMRATDIVARIGGDEFVAMAVVEKTMDGEMIKTRIKKLTEEFNEHCVKEYYIGMSVGYSEFLCNEEVPLEDYLGQADEKLYEDKQKKRKDIMKKTL